MDIDKLDKNYDFASTENEDSKDYTRTNNYQINIERKTSNISILLKETIYDKKELTEWKLFKILLMKLMFALIFLLISLIIQGFLMIYSDSYYKRYTKPLSDRIHSFFEEPPTWVSYNLSNNLIAVLTLAFLQLILFNRLNYTLDYAINKKTDKSTFCNCENNYNSDEPLCSFRKSYKENKISLHCSDHIFHAYAGDGNINFLLFKFLRNVKRE
ncbi:sphingomyelin synthase 2, putative (SMS2) [Plasmodium malariae]|uniref:Sphingomyelin synthase 2, putative (SMS2) n=1 Tax=Plasmodium malariae TaxID=5858 RepID=A0A1A8W2E1_PLAMA|nr:sphingomyelin synthase 2, putative (SMS2) [Plasmodium malariae]